MTASQYLEGQILIAMPGIGDPRFDRSLIFMCAHSKSGAMGIIVNKTAPMMFFSDLVDQLKIVPSDEIRDLSPPVLNLPVLFGGPVEQFRGFVQDADPRLISNLIVDMSLNNPAAVAAALKYAGIEGAEATAAAADIATARALDLGFDGDAVTDAIFTGSARFREEDLAASAARANGSAFNMQT